MRLALILCLLICVEQAQANSVVSARPIRANSVITEDDVSISSAGVKGAFSDPRHVIGLEAKTAIYPGRPIFHNDLRAPAAVERNETVPLVFQRGGLFIQTEGRALGRGAVGEIIRVMNISSRKTVFGEIHADGSVVVE